MKRLPRGYYNAGRIIYVDNEVFQLLFERAFSMFTLNTHIPEFTDST